MKIHFLGVGEACDPDFPNTSILVDTSSGQALLDCGFTVPHRYFALHDDPEKLDILWISHFHADHFFGVPLLLLRFWEMGRKKPLTIVGQPGTKQKISAAMELAFPTLYDRFNYTINYIEIKPDTKIKENDMSFSTAVNDHSAPCLAVRLDYEDKSLFYSGDGRPTEASLKLATDCNLVIHEAYRANGDTPGHGSITGCIDFAVQAKAQNLALVHIQRQERKDNFAEIETQLLDAGIPFLIPQPGDIHTL